MARLLERIRKTVEALKQVTAGRHPESPGQSAAPAAVPQTPADQPHVRADTMTEVNLRLEKAYDPRKERTGLEDPEELAAAKGKRTQSEFEKYFGPQAAERAREFLRSSPPVKTRPSLADLLLSKDDTPPPPMQDWTQEPVECPWSEEKYRRQKRRPAPKTPVEDDESLKKALSKGPVVDKKIQDEVIGTLPSSDQPPAPASGRPLSLTELWRAYKHSPHDPMAVFLKFAVHRIEHRAAYQKMTPEQRMKLDQQWLKFHQAGAASERNGKLTLDELHKVLRTNVGLIPQLLAAQRSLHNQLKKHAAKHIVTIDGKPHITLYRGLGVPVGGEGAEHSLASYADNARTPTGFGSHIHARHVPLDNIWFSFDLGPKAASSTEYGPEDEIIVSNHPVKRAEVTAAARHQQIVPKRAYRSKPLNELAFRVQRDGWSEQDWNTMRQWIAQTAVADPTNPNDAVHRQGVQDFVSNVRFTPEQTDALVNDWANGGRRSPALDLAIAHNELSEQAIRTLYAGNIDAPTQKALARQANLPHDLFDRILSGEDVYVRSGLADKSNLSADQSLRLMFSDDRNLQIRAFERAHPKALSQYVSHFLDSLDRSAAAGLPEDHEHRILDQRRVRDALHHALRSGFLLAGLGDNTKPFADFDPQVADRLVSSASSSSWIWGDALARLPISPEQQLRIASDKGHNHTLALAGNPFLTAEAQKALLAAEPSTEAAYPPGKRPMAGLGGWDFGLSGVYDPASHRNNTPQDYKDMLHARLAYNPGASADTLHALAQTDDSHGFWDTQRGTLTRHHATAPHTVSQLYHRALSYLREVPIEKLKDTGSKERRRAITAVWTAHNAATRFGETSDITHHWLDTLINEPWAQAVHEHLGLSTPLKDMMKLPDITPEIHAKASKAHAKVTGAKVTSAEPPETITKSDKIADMIKQVKGDDPEGFPRYAQRFSLADPKDPSRHYNRLALSRDMFPNITTKLVPPTSSGDGSTYYHHTATLDNHTYHTISTSQNPSDRGLAGIITAKHDDGQQYVRAAYTSSVLPTHLETLSRRVQADENTAYSAAFVLKPEHMAEGWEQHHPDLVNGMVPDVHLAQTAPTITNWLSFAGVPGDTTPRVVMKEALGRFGTPTYKGNTMVSHLDQANFTTAHREAMYSKLAHDIFGLGQFVPRATVFTHPLSKTPWSAMEFIPNAKHVTPEADLRKHRESGDLHKLAIMNVILGNNDRHSNNLIADAIGMPKLIDNGLAFDYAHCVATSPIPAYIAHAVNDTLPSSVHHWLMGLDSAKMVNAMKDMGMPTETIKMATKRLAMARMWSEQTRLPETGVAPSLGPLMSLLHACRFTLPPEQFGKKIDGKVRVSGPGQKSLRPEQEAATLKVGD